MLNRAHMNQIRAIQSLREAQANTARDAFVVAQRERESAIHVRDEQLALRDTAHGTWNRLLGADRPNPSLVRLSGAWLLSQQSRLDTEELNLSVAENRRGHAGELHGQALAREAAAKKTYAQVQRTMENYLEERQSAQLIDALLLRHRK